MKTILIAIQAAVTPLPASVDDDIRCTAVLTSTLTAARSDAERASLTAAMMYFIGRVEGASPKTDLPAAVDQAKDALATVPAPKETLLRCGVRLAKNNKVFAAFDPNIARIGEVR